MSTPPTLSQQKIKAQMFSGVSLLRSMMARVSVNVFVDAR